MAYDALWLAGAGAAYEEYLDPAQLGCRRSHQLHVAALIDLALVRFKGGLDTWTGMGDLYKFFDLIDRNAILLAAADAGIEGAGMAGTGM